MNQGLGRGVSQPIAGKPARMGRASGYKMQAFAKTPQISSPSATTTRYSLYERICRCGLHIGSAQQRSRLVRQSDEFAGERSSGNGFPSSESVRLQQPLLPHPQEGWWSKTHSRSQKSESRPYETAVQDDYIKADPLANMVIFAESEIRLLSRPDSPPPQAVLEIRLWGSGLSIHGPPLRAVPGFPHFYEVHGCGSIPAETDGHLHPELPQRLAHFGQVGGRDSISQIRASQQLRVPRNQGQFCQERAVPQPTDFVPGNSYRLVKT